MVRHSSGFKAVLGLFVVVVFSMSTFADTIRLKDGSLIKGTIVSFVDGRFVVVVGDGARRRELTLSSDEIASIEFEPRSPANSTSASVPNRPAADSSIVPVSSRTPPKVAVTDKTASTASRPAQDPPVQDRSVSQPRQLPVTDRNADTPPSLSRMPDTTRQAPADTSSAKPISLSLKVLADNTANGWTNSGFVVKKGQRIRVTGSGSVSLGRGNTSTPSGLPDLDDDQKLLKAVPTGALIAVIGDDNNDFIYIGESREFTAGRDGSLYLGVNEGNLNDNKGSYVVKVEILPDK